MRGDKMCNRRTSSKESFDIGERRSGDGDESDMLERGVGPEDWKNKRVMEKFSELLKLIESYRQRLAEVEEEVRKGHSEIGTISPQRTPVLTPC